MMPGIGFAEMLLLALVAVVVIGPKDLPLMARKFGRFTGKMRAMAFEFKQGFDELGRQAELEELRKEVADLKKHTGLEDLERDFNNDAYKMQSDMNAALNPPAPALPEPAKDPVLPYPGLSAEDPGYETGEDHRIGGYQQDPPPAAAPSSDTPPAATPEPVKQDTPA
ncbi:MAG TPA: Sec-independent protein translocase protein TatB [Hyphomonadaceae bacterium]|jgi:sec-independent protein translocase protein TatB|nr:Sec-independent protein translocase protein TatB [Hyphomonadaceae bacterium]